MKSNASPAKKTLPLEEDAIGEVIAGPAIEVLRSSDVRQAILKAARLGHRAIEEHLAVGAARRQVLLSAAAHVFEKLPKIMEKLTTAAAEGNPAACKLILEIAGLKESIAETVAAQGEVDDGGDSLEMTFLKDLPERIKGLPPRADLLTQK